MDDREWCRKHIDDNSIWRSTIGETIPAKDGGRYFWQFYLRKSLFDPEFAFKIGELFYEQLSGFDFQIGSCETAGVPVGVAIQNAFFRRGENINHFSIRKEQKSYGLMNWTEGKLKKGVPVLLVDDLAGSQATLKVAESLIQHLKLPLLGHYATLVDKTINCHKESYLDRKLISLYNLNEFCLTRREYLERYGKYPSQL